MNPRAIRPVFAVLALIAATSAFAAQSVPTPVRITLQVSTIGTQVMAQASIGSPARYVLAGNLTLVTAGQVVQSIPINGTGVDLAPLWVAKATSKAVQVEAQFTGWAQLGEDYYVPVTGRAVAFRLVATPPPLRTTQRPTDAPAGLGNRALSGRAFERN